MLSSFVSKIRDIYVPALHAQTIDTEVREIQNKRDFVIQDHKFVSLKNL